MKSPLHQPAIHESGLRHTTGEARYVDDIPLPPGGLVATLVLSPHAHARILSRSRGGAMGVPGVHAVLFAEDVPGDVHIGPIVHDEPVLATDTVHYVGQPVALVLGESYEACRAGAAHVEVAYEELPAIHGIAEAIAAGAFLTRPHVIARGDVEEALASAPIRIAAEVANGAQDHFYLETQAALCVPEEDGSFRIVSSTQHPTEIQRMAAHVLGIGEHRVTCEVPRMGGGFGGKESQATTFGALAALGAAKTGRAVRVWLDRDTDMTVTGRRHPFWSRYEAGFDDEGQLLGLRVHIYSDGGFTLDLSPAIMDRALFHLDNAYHVPACRFEGRVCRTNRASNTAFRGFGGPQGVLVIEDALNRCAERLGLDPAEVRRRNLYGERGTTTPYGQEVPEPRAARIWEELATASEYAARREAIDAFNATSRHYKRGIAYQPVKFGISFTNALLNQAGALVLVYADGTVQLNHGGTEMGQGLHSKMLAVAAHELGLPVERVRVMTTSTEKVPNTSPTAASSGSDLNGAAVREACATVRERMRPVAARLLDALPESVRFEEGEARAEGRAVPLAQVAKQCWLERVSLSATGYYATPGIAYDADRGRGTPFYYFAWGGAVVEVELCTLTGEHRLTRVDILHDVGDSLIPTIDRGQVEGGFVQGYGWLTMEELVHDDNGRNLTHGPSTYKIPAFGDIPEDFRVALLDRATQEGVIGGSKAVGEPPFLLAIGVLTALRHALGAIAPGEVELSVPATGEALLRAVEGRREAARGQREVAK